MRSKHVKRMSTLKVLKFPPVGIALIHTISDLPLTSLLHKSASQELQDTLHLRSMTEAKAPTEFEIYNSQVSILTLPTFTRLQLAQYNGRTKNQLYVAIRGYVYDVTSNEKNYGVGKTYHLLVGKDVSRLLGINKLKLQEDNSSLSSSTMANTWYTGDLTEKQNEKVDKWAEFFRKRYRIVGVVIDHRGTAPTE